ncbi:glycoside hydrolase family 1 protein [Vibrio parahaemolyticus]|uniref:glycoside hydrolase family 1 protein n=1 Tax=Vibrio parahaemolyticus TaxID=670 RepID=UPI0024BC0877|nr:glycoside hydrolase family 1 protein [Vibrio parahaemolyticus]EGQ8194986.1 glycoside hydrolase family 1 protein [Vibrio parahaemolyticus]WHT02203.1 glycoside hydrolase family 1 protein [Vibrio parahaemolyticus]
MFPTNFLWGASTSAYQCEGASTSHGKGPSVMDVSTVFDECGVTNVEVASDHYHRFVEDIALMAEMGLKAYRFSMSWSRILPNGIGQVNEEGIAHYHRVLDELEKHGIEPIVTMYHFDLPLALEQQGGWSNRDTVDAFAQYASVLFENFGQRVNYWLTINEQNMMIIHGEVLGTNSGDDSDSNAAKKDLYQQNHHMLLAQARAMILCHTMTDAKIGPAPNISSVYPATPHPEDMIAASDATAIRNWLYLDAAVFGTYNSVAWSFMEKESITPKIHDGDMTILKSADPDFIAFNYYSNMTIKRHSGVESERAKDQQMGEGELGYFESVSNSELSTNEYGWEIDPIGFRYCFREIWDRYKLPMIVTENGLGAKDELIIGEDNQPTVIDDYRINFLRSHVEQIKFAIDDGCEVMGYCPWSAIDLVSTHQGISKRYGFIYVNRDEFDLKDMSRYKKKSFYWYQKVINSNGLEL